MNDADDGLNQRNWHAERDRHDDRGRHAERTQQAAESYQEKLLDQHERQQAALHNRLLQNANIIVLTLSFVFLFEMTFIGGVFPDHPSSIHIERYWPCLALLLIANILLVLSMALLLSAIVRFSTPWPTRDDYLAENGAAPNVRLLSIRYAIIRAAEKTMLAQEKIIMLAKQHILAGVMVGALSALVFITCIWGDWVNGLNGLFKITRGTALVIIGVFSMITAIYSVVIYVKSTKVLRSLYAPITAKAVAEQTELVKAIKSVPETDSSSFGIAMLAHAYQTDFLDKCGYKWPLEYDTVWLNVTRACNLHCDRCFASTAASHCAMDAETLEGLLSIAEQAGVTKAVLTGGDALLYDKLQMAINLAHDKGMRVLIPTSGYELADEKLFATLCATLDSQDMVNISLKGWDEESYRANAGTGEEDEAFTRSLEVIRKLVESPIPVCVSMVLDDRSFPGFLKGVEKAVEKGVEEFLFSAAFEVVGLEGEEALLPPSSARSFSDGLRDHYERLCEITGGRFVFEHTLPLCFFDSDLVDEMYEDGHLSGPCQLHVQNGLVFGPDGSLLMCNAFHSSSPGRYGEDFETYEELVALLSSKEVRDAQRQLSGFPSEDCLYCLRSERCAGGCATRWTKFDFGDFKALKKW